MARDSLLLLLIAGCAEGWHPGVPWRAPVSPRVMVAVPVAHPLMASAQDGMGAGASDPDRFLNELEEALKSAVDLELFDEAVKARQRLQEFMLERGDVNGVLHANRDFYEAFSTGNYDRMGAIWFKDDHVQCVHAGHKALRGYDRIMAAFAAQFRTVRSLTVTADDVRVTVRGTLAWVLCTQQMRHAPTGTNRALIATNIFRCVGGRWQLVHHHAGYAKSASGLGGALGGVFGSLGEGEGGGGMSGGIRIIDTSAMMGGGGSLEDVTGLIGRVIDGSSGGAHLLASAGDDGMLLADDEQAAEELCRVTLQYVCALGRERALTSRQKRLLVTDVIEHDGCESPAYIVRAFKLLCLNKHGQQTDSFGRDEFLVQCKLEARRLAASQERPRATLNRDEQDADDECADRAADALLD